MLLFRSYNSPVPQGYHLSFLDEDIEAYWIEWPFQDHRLVVDPGKILWFVFMWKARNIGPLHILSICPTTEPHSQSIEPGDEAMSLWVHYTKKSQLCFFWDRYDIAQANFKFPSLLWECWVYRHMLPCQAEVSAFNTHVNNLGILLH